MQHTECQKAASARYFVGYHQNMPDPEEPEPPQPVPPDQGQKAPVREPPGSPSAPPEDPSTPPVGDPVPKVPPKLVQG